MKKIGLTMGFVIILLFTSPVWAEKNISVVFPTWEPYGYMDRGKAAGFEIETFQAIMDIMGIRVTFANQPWKRCLHSVKHGLADVVISALKVKERSQYLFYPDEPISIGRTALFTRKESQIDFNGSFEALKGYTIGVTSGFSYGRAFDQSHFLHKDPSTETGAVVMKVLLGRNELGAGNIAVVKTIAGKQRAGKIRFLFPVIHIQRMYAGFSKASTRPDLVKAFSTALVEFKRTVDYNRLMEKYNMD